jgi:hypothetical protein
MAGRNLAMNTHTMRPSDLQSDVSEEKGKRALPGLGDRAVHGGKRKVRCGRGDCRNRMTR